MKIGVFDSGVGGQSVVNAISAKFPELEILYADDSKNLPYGTKTPDELYSLALPILNTLSNKGCQIIVVACNTITTTIIDRLRTSLPIPLIGIEPMIKPASKLTKSGTIAVCATPSTLDSPRYNWLISTYAKNVKVLEPDCSTWAGMIESSKVDHDKIYQSMVEVCQQGADVIVLGCTHYHWIEQDIKKIANKYNATVIQPESAIVKQLKVVLEQLS